MEIERLRRVETSLALGANKRIQRILHAEAPPDGLARAEGSEGGGGISVSIPYARSQERARPRPETQTVPSVAFAMQQNTLSVVVSKLHALWLCHLQVAVTFRYLQARAATLANDHCRHAPSHPCADTSVRHGYENHNHTKAAGE